MAYLYSRPAFNLRITALASPLSFFTKPLLNFLTWVKPYRAAERAWSSWIFWVWPLTLLSPWLW